MAAVMSITATSATNRVLISSPIVHLAAVRRWPTSRTNALPLGLQTLHCTTSENRRMASFQTDNPRHFALAAMAPLNCSNLVMEVDGPAGTALHRRRMSLLDRPGAT